MCSLKSFSVSLLLLVSIKYIESASTNEKNDECGGNQEKEEKRILKIIKEGQAAAETYDLPKDASQHRPKDQTIRDFNETYDFVICGGGASGTVLARRLSEITSWKILLLEPGDFSNGNDGFLQFPKYFAQHAFSKFNWGYQTVPQTKGCQGVLNNTCYCHRGKGVGGNTLISPTVYDRGSAQDYNNWARIANDCSWNYKNMLKYMKKMETFDWTDHFAPVDVSSHGTKGPLHVQHKLPPYEDELWLDANRELGYNIKDYNGPDRDGGSILQQCTKKGARQDLGTAYIKPVQSRPNLHISTGSYVTTVDIDNSTKKAQCVIFSNSGKTFRVNVKKEVILSAGSIGTAKILMQSGVGPKTHLESLGIPCIQNSEVGSNYKEHVQCSALFFSTNKARPQESLNQGVKDYVNDGIGDLTAPSKAQATGSYILNANNIPQKCNVDEEGPDFLLHTDVASKSKDLQRYLGLTDNNYEACWGKNKNAFVFVIKNVNPQSKGTLRLSNKDPYSYPLIDPKVLTDQKDLDLLYKGIRLVFKIINTGPYNKLNVSYNGNPLPACKKYKFQSADYWKCFLQQTSTISNNPTGTCPMGSDPSKGAVVDSKLRVFGVKGLRVADASVLPSPPCGDANIPAAVVGEKLSDDLKDQYLD